MKVSELFEGVDWGDHVWAQGIENKNKPVSRKDPAIGSTKGFWLIDRATGKKLAGPFKNDDDAVRFKQSRTDRIPANARIVFI